MQPRNNHTGTKCGPALLPGILGDALGVGGNQGGRYTGSHVPATGGGTGGQGPGAGRGRSCGSPLTWEVQGSGGALPRGDIWRAGAGAGHLLQMTHVTLK